MNPLLKVSNGFKNSQQVWNANYIKSIPINDSLGPPVDGQVIIYDENINSFKYGGIEGTVPNGNCNGDYLYWDQPSGDWVLGSLNVKLGCNSGQSNQSTQSIAIGLQAGQSEQQAGAISLGYQAGQYTQQLKAIAIGNQAGQTNQKKQAIAIGNQAGQLSQGSDTVAIGTISGQNNQANASIAIGAGAGTEYQNGGIAIGVDSARESQGLNAIAIGAQAGRKSQGVSSIAIGNQAGNSGQLDSCVAIGNGAGQLGQGGSAVAIGLQSGSSTTEQQGGSSTCIGSNAKSTFSQSIVLNASTSAFFSNTSLAFYVNPIRTNTNPTANTLLAYDTSTREVYNCAKTFVIDHPKDQDKYLVHACLEGPEAGVYYRGKSEIINNKYVEISLPDYVDVLATDFSIQVTPIHNKYNNNIILNVSEIENNKFTVFGENCKFYWHVYGTRHNIVVEPDKKDSRLRGDGPYTWIE
jgi:hypothetical protein